MPVEVSKLIPRFSGTATSSPRLPSIRGLCTRR